MTTDERFPVSHDATLVRTVMELHDSFDSMAATALKVKEERDLFLEELRNMAANFESISELIDGYVDVEDGDYGQPRANKAMRAKQCADDSIAAIERAIAKAEGR